MWYKEDKTANKKFLKKSAIVHFFSAFSERSIKKSFKTTLENIPS